VRVASTPAPSGKLSLVAYLGIFTLLSLRWIRSMTHAIPASRDIVFVYGDDARLHVWILAWVAHALASLPGAFLDANINYPAPRQLTGSEHFASSQIVFAPVYWLGGNPVLAANVLVFLSYPLAAFAMERLLTRLGCALGAAWVGGLLFALGPLRVPANMQLPQYFNLYFPLLAIALVKLREQPDLRRAIATGLVFAAGVFSSYYMALMLSLVGGLWAVGELLRRTPRRVRFALLALGATGVVAILLAIASRPYFGRPEEAGPSNLLRGWSDRNFKTPFGWVAMLRLLWSVLFGDVQLVLALAGLSAIFSRSAAIRRIGVLGLAFALVGGTLMLMPKPIAAVILASPMRFFRAPWRFAVVLGFGTALLAAAALEVARARTRKPVFTALAVVAGLAVALDLGIGQFMMTMDEIAPIAVDRPVYDEIGAYAKAHGGGAMLELPLIDWHARTRAPDGRRFVPHASLEPDAMLGSTRHWLPILNGHTGYSPPHRTTLLHTIERLPSAEALGDIVDMTHVRWLVLRPADYWQVLETRGWVLAEIEREPEHPEWFRTIAAGEDRPGYTVLGMPLVPLPRATAIARVAALDPPDHVTVRKSLRLRLRIDNAGTNGWPAATAKDAPANYVVGLVSHWRAIELGPEEPPPAPRPGALARAGVDGRPRMPRPPPTVERFPLRRDVQAAESIVQDVVVQAPGRSGVYELEVRVQQRAGARFTRRGNSPLVLRVAVNR
jgi:hypothetical protein